MQRINEDIKSQNFRPVYLIYGVESYLVGQNKQKLQSALLGDGASMNVNRFTGKGISVDEVIDAAETMPFFAPRRIILLENTEWFKVGRKEAEEDAAAEGDASAGEKTAGRSQSGPEKLAAYLSTIPETTVFVFAEDSADKRSKLYKAVEKNGICVECARQKEEDLMKWILGKIRREGKQIRTADAAFFLENAGDDMENISNELEKLLCYCADKEAITAEDIQQICVHQIQNQIFDMITAIAKHQQKKALSLYEDLLMLREPPMKILALISRQFAQLLQVKSMAAKGAGRDQVAAAMGLKPFVAGKFLELCRGFGRQQLKDALEICVSGDQDIKTGRMTDQMSVELVIIACSSLTAGDR